MQNDTRMIDLLAEMLHEIKGLREDFQGLEKEQHIAVGIIPNDAKSSLEAVQQNG
jgi:hypothetical protein